MLKCNFEGLMFHVMKEISQMGIIISLSKNEVLLRIIQGDECMNGK